MTKREHIYRIIDATADEFGVTKDEILSKSRLAHVVLPRHVAAYLSRSLHETMSFGVLGGIFRRDHSSIIYAVHRGLRILIEDPAMKSRYERILAASRAVQ